MRRELETLAKAVCLSPLGCSAHPGDNPKLQGQNEHCATTLSDTPVVTTPPDEEDQYVSRIVVRAMVARERLQAEIESRIPAVLAEEKNRPIGAPGRVSYVVKRGAVTPGLHEGNFRTTVTARADISVCKPLGPFCVGYGSCQPVFVSTVDLPLTLTEDYAWQRPSTNIRVAKGCNIAGYDATPRLRTIAESNLGAVTSRVASGLPQLKPGIEQAWKLLETPVYLDKDWCLRLRPKGLVQGPAREEPERFQVSAALDAELAVQKSCDTNAKTVDLPPLDRADSLADTGTLYLGQRLTKNDLQKQLSATLRGEVDGGEKIASVEVNLGTFEGQDTLLVGLTLDGRTCGTAWFSAQPKAISADRLKLVRVTPVTPAESATTKVLSEHVERVAILKPEFPFAGARDEIEAMVTGLSQGLTAGVLLRLELGAPEPLPPDVEPEGLELWSSVKQRAVASVE